MKSILRNLIAPVGCILLLALEVAAQLNENCTVSILNRTAQVRPDGSWRIDNVPTGFGNVRARATCVENGITRSGQSELLSLSANSVTGFNAHILLGDVTPIPQTLTITAGNTTLTQVGQTTPLTVVAAYAGGTTQNVTAANTGTTYNISNTAIATITPNGLVTAVSTGTALIRASNEGTAGLFTIQVVLSGDKDGDGIPDDVELSQGLNPNNPADGFEDPDKDGLSNKDEFARGTQMKNADTDGDSILDGEEVVAGADGFITNPLLADSDGDGVRDALEIATGSNPTNASSVNLAQALNSISVTPAKFLLTVNSIVGEASQQLTVTGALKDNSTMDLTSTLRGTNYTSSNLNVCNFGAPDGRVFAANNGSCTITVTNSGFMATASGIVNSFTPTPLSFVSIPGFANNVDVSGNFAFVAAGSTGLQVVNVANHFAPVIVASRDTPGNANDVSIVGDLAFVADGVSGLQIINIANPLAPVIVGSLDTPGDAWDVVVRDNRAYVADGASGLRIIDVSTPSNPRLLGSIDPPGTQKGVDVDPVRRIAVLASGTSGIQVVDVSNPASPMQIGSVSTAGDARDIVLKGNFAFVADFSRSFTSVDITVPANPVVRSSTPQSTGGLLQDVAVAGNFGFGADALFVNGVPIIDITNGANPIPRAILNFSNFRDDNGTGIAVDSSYVYLTAERGISENGTSGDTRLYIGQYLALEDKAGVAPTTQITSPSTGSTVIEGSTVPVRVDAIDDVAVAAVNFLINGAVVGVDTTSPYEFGATAPSSGSSFTLGARAVDLGGNTGTAPNVVLNVIPDPRTTAQGRVISQTGSPVGGANVTCLTMSTSSLANGTFSIPGLPTILGPISCTATFASPTGIVSGRSAAFPPVAGGITNVGDIVLTGSAPLTFLVGSSFNNIGGVLDSVVMPDLPPLGSFSPGGSGVIFTGNFLRIGVNAQGSLNFSGVGLQFSQAGNGTGFNPDLLFQGTVRDVYGVRFDAGGSSFSAFGGSFNSPNDGNVLVVSFDTFQDANLNAARSVTQTGSLRITTTTAFRRTDPYASVDITLTNTGSIPMTNIRLSRSSDFDVLSVNGFTDVFDIVTTPNGGTVIGAGEPSRSEFYGMGTAAPISVADGITFASNNPDVFRNLDPNGISGDLSASLVFFVNTLAPGESVRLTSRR